MKSYQFAERAIHCGQASQWDQLLAACAQETPGTVVDLRTFIELADQQAPKTPDGWGYRRLPMTGATVSEQDLDVFRREFFRKPQTVVIGPNTTRGQLLVAASLSRLEKGGWQGGRRAEADLAHGEHDLQDWLTTYLVRHGYEDESALEGITAKTPSQPGPPAPAEKPSPPPANSESSFEIEPTVEMEAVGQSRPSLATEPTVEMTSPLAAGPAPTAEPAAEEPLLETAGNEMPSVESDSSVETPGAATANRKNPPKGKTASKSAARRKT